MIITSEYLRTHYTGADATTDTVAEQCLRSSLGEVESMLGQPVQLRSITWYFTGDGRAEVLLPYTLKVASVVVQYRPSFDEAWETVDDTEYERPVIRCKDGFTRGGSYRATMNVGLADVVGPALISGDFTTDFRYEALRSVICEIAEYKFYASSKTNTGHKRSGLDSVSESVPDGVTKTTRFTSLEDRMVIWQSKLTPYMKLKTF